MSGYDPFAYGQVRLGGAAGQPQGQPDDILFADQAVAATKTAPASSSDWDLLDGEVGSLLPAPAGRAAEAGLEQFAADVLGEATATAMAPAAAAVAPAPAPRRPAMAAPQLRAAEPAPLPAPLPRPKEKLAVAARPAAFDLQPHSSGAALLVPMLLLGAGTAGGAWLATIGQNPVLAGIAGAAAAIGALFCRVWLRR